MAEVKKTAYQKDCSPSETFYSFVIIPSTILPRLLLFTTDFPVLQALGPGFDCK